MAKKIGKEQYSYLLNKFKKIDISLLTNISQSRWGPKFREEFRDEFNKSYETFLATNKVILFGKEISEGIK